MTNIVGLSRNETGLLRGKQVLYYRTTAVLKTVLDESAIYTGVI